MSDDAVPHVRGQDGHVVAILRSYAGQHPHDKGLTVLLAGFNGTALNAVAEQLRDEYDVTTQVTGFRPHPRRSSG